MSQQQEQLRIIFSGGGTGGHIFPAVAIADRVKELVPTAQISFVGAQDKMEMERVPKAGYPIEGLWISGLQRKLTVQNLLFPVKVLASLWKAGRIVRRIQPQVVVGTGGFASGPLLRQAAAQGIPTLIQEQNAYAGLTNKWLAKVASRICVAYPGMEQFFPANKLMEVGNPVREDMLATQENRAEACAHYGFSSDQPVILVTGGSLGARTLNQALAAAYEQLAANPEVQVLWQCGKYYNEEYSKCATAQLPNVNLLPFLDRMDLAYAAADIVISRAGALTIAEICLLGKASILVPSPNVAEDHQTKNALALTNRKAAILVKDQDAKASLIATAINLLQDEKGRKALAQNAQLLAYPNAADKIAREVLRLAKWEITNQPSTNN
ncbi:undecaprenyldiphospho-muramoylpentapeptide beta-N-acetylglucosaminyltransferase [Lewinella sp. LCG006]|uniref:undecaprenyldiphospho-muramoylpentapeptide beta-N-acetylglucosaminyltransferase n=1 Tax=Lewinella sp. LCG006 TaxID=3231911 RepID=UPI0034609354